MKLSFVTKKINMATFLNSFSVVVTNILKSTFTSGSF